MWKSSRNRPPSRCAHFTALDTSDVTGAIEGHGKMWLDGVGFNAGRQEGERRREKAEGGKLYRDRAKADKCRVRSPFKKEWPPVKAAKVLLRV